MSEQLTLWPAEDPPPPTSERPKNLISFSNSNLARDGIGSWTLPALAARLPDGQSVATCPAAGVCAQACYARFGSYKWPNVLAAHVRNLLFVLEDLPGWEEAMRTELAKRKYQGKYIRIHDAGDFFSDPYTQAWLRIIRATPGVRFYCYTKEVDRLHRLVKADPPANFRWVFSLGGREDRLLEPDDPIADVFPTEEAIREARYFSQRDSDLLAVDGPQPVGMSVNNIPKARKLLGDRTFGRWQREEDARREARRGGES